MKVRVQVNCFLVVILLDYVLELRLLTQIELFEYGLFGKGEDDDDDEDEEDHDGNSQV